MSNDIEILMFSEQYLDLVHAVENGLGRRLTDKELADLYEISNSNHLDKLESLRIEIAEIGNALQEATNEFVKSLKENDEPGF